jgi:hypothetical protein
VTSGKADRLLNPASRPYFQLIIFDLRRGEFGQSKAPRSQNAAQKGRSLQRPCVDKKPRLSEPASEVADAARR